MTPPRRSIWEWSKDYVGDPSSWETRGTMILEFLWENGLMADHDVLDIGCGNLSEGAPLIRALDKGRFVGIEPNGWLVEAALEEMPDLEDRGPIFLWRTDFDASKIDRIFSFVVSHSVLSHAAHHQLDQYLANTRKVVEEGAVMLASLRVDQYNSFSPEWVYPGVSTFRLPTVQVAGQHHGWRIEIMHDYRERMLEVAPADAHEWIRCVAVPSADELNERRLTEEALQAEERETLALAQIARRDELQAEDEARIKEAGLE